MVEVLVEHTKAYFKSRQGVVESIIDVDVVRAVIQCMKEAAEVCEGHGVPAQLNVARQGVDVMDLGDGVQVYNVMTDMTQFVYRRALKAWEPVGSKPPLFPGVDAKVKLYADRFHTLWARLLLEGKLVPEVDAADGSLLPHQRVVTPVESLVGNPGRKLTFGLISRVTDECANGSRRWVLEDLHSVYPLELEVAESDQLVTDGSFVLAEGEMVGSSFRVYSLEVPAAIPRKVSKERDMVPSQVFGGNLSEEQIVLLAQAEPANPDGMYAVLSEVHLDSARVLEKLSDLFQGYEESTPPVAYVLMGSFCSSPFIPTAEGVRSYREGFERLKLMMRHVPNHVQRGTRFIFMPGPQDPGSPTLPRTPLTGYLTADLAKEIPGVIFTTNPCRIRHFSRELVFFRHDVLKLCRRHEVIPLRETDADGQPASPTPQHVRNEMVRLLYDQAHLVPLPLEESNILWNFDHTLRLYPLPDAVFVGGVTEPFECGYQQSTFCSVGPFHRDAAFYSYSPVKELLEPCDVPDKAG